MTFSAIVKHLQIFSLSCLLLFESAQLQVSHGSHSLCCLCEKLKLFSLTVSRHTHTEEEVGFVFSLRKFASVCVWDRFSGLPILPPPPPPPPLPPLLLLSFVPPPAGLQTGNRCSLPLSSLFLPFSLPPLLFKSPFLPFSRSLSTSSSAATSFSLSLMLPSPHPSLYLMLSHTLPPSLPPSLFLHVFLLLFFLPLQSVYYIYSTSFFLSLPRPSLLPSLIFLFVVTFVCF